MITATCAKSDVIRALSGIVNVTTASSTLTESALTSFTELTSDTGGLEMGEKASIGIGVSIAVLVLGTGAYFLGSAPARNRPHISSLVVLTRKVQHSQARNKEIIGDVSCNQAVGGRARLPKLAPQHGTVELAPQAEPV